MKVINKRAMFVLFQALKQQFGGLFLAQRQSADSQETRGNFKTNSGAMFGLDARIALAIFGALSVISGAALYSAIQDAKTEQYKQVFDSMIKAHEAYYLDTGKPLPLFDARVAYTPDLIENRESLATWKGPYLSDFTKTAVYAINNQLLGATETFLLLQKKSNWPATNAWQDCTVNDADCIEWAVVFCSDATTIANINKMFDYLDKDIDNSDGADTGKVRYIKINATAEYLLYQGMINKRR